MDVVHNLNNIFLIYYPSLNKCLFIFDSLIGIYFLLLFKKIKMTSKFFLKIKFEGLYFIFYFEKVIVLFTNSFGFLLEPGFKILYKLSPHILQHWSSDAIILSVLSLSYIVILYTSCLTLSHMLHFCSLSCLYTSNLILSVIVQILHQ